MIILEGSDECNDCGCNLYTHCENYEGDKMSSKMLMARDRGCEVYFETGDGENIYLEIDDPDYFEVCNVSLKVQIPLDKWNSVVKEYQEKYFRHVRNKNNNIDKQLELGL